MPQKQFTNFVKKTSFAAGLNLFQAACVTNGILPNMKVHFHIDITSLAATCNNTCTLLTSLPRITS